MPALLPFPKDEDVARAFFAEAVRHLQDARVLHVSTRYAAAMTSSMKAVELSLKSLLIVHGASRWLDNALNSHAVLKEMSNVTSVSEPLLDAIETFDSTLLGDIKLLEKLVPSKINVSRLTFDEAANTEYPFLAFDPSAISTLTLYSPSHAFRDADSLHSFRTAYRLLHALKSLSPEIQVWKTRLCRSL